MNILEILHNDLAIVHCVLTLPVIINSSILNKLLGCTVDIDKLSTISKFFNLKLTFRCHLAPSSELRIESTFLREVSFPWKRAGSRRRNLSKLVDRKYDPVSRFVLALADFDRLLDPSGLAVGFVPRHFHLVPIYHVVFSCYMVCDGRFVLLFLC